MKKLTQLEKDVMLRKFKDLKASEYTEEMCRMAVKEDFENMKYVPKRIATLDFCIEMIHEHFYVFTYLRKEMIRKETIIAFLETLKRKNGGFYARGYILEDKIKRFKDLNFFDFMDKDVALALVNCEPLVLKDDRYITKEYREDIDVQRASLKEWGDALQFMDKNEITKEDVDLAIKNSVSANYIPKQFLNDELADELVRRGGNTLLKLPKKYQTYERCLTIIENRGHVYQLPKHCQTQEFFETMAEKLPEYFFMIPSEFVTREMVEMSVEKGNRYLKNVPLELVDEELAYKLVCKGVSIGFLCMNQHLTERIIRRAIENNGHDLTHIPIEMRTNELLKLAVKTEPNTILKAPYHSIDEEVVYEALCNGVSIEYAMKLIEEFQSQRIVDKYFERGATELKWVRKEFMTPEVLETAIKKNRRNIKFAPKSLVTKEMWVEATKEMTIREFEIAYKKIPKKLLNDSFLTEIIKNNWRLIRVLPKELQTPEVCMTALGMNEGAIDYFK